MNEDLQQRIDELEKKIKVLEEHQHLGSDGSKEFTDLNKIKCNEVEISGLASADNLFAVPKWKMYDDDDISKERREISQAVGVSNKGGVNERSNYIFQVGKGHIKGQSNIQDWNKINFSQVILSHDPNGYPWFFFSKETPPIASFLIARRTPIVFGEGFISGDTLTDETANFPVGKTPASLAQAEAVANGVIHSICIIKNEDFTTIEAVKIYESTKTTLKFERSADTQGKVRYEILTPTALGSTNAPFSIGYFGEGLILGYGERTTNNKISTITWGNSGTPEGRVFAAPGSLYLNQGGGAGTTLYIKESGTSRTGWVAK
jgi:hypothetical protein